MTAIGDVLQIKLIHELFGQVCINIGFWEVGVGSTGNMFLASIIDEFIADYEATVLGLLSDEVTLTEVEILNLTNGVDFATATPLSSGSQPGDCLPPFNAIAVKLNRATRLTRNGAKRIAGIPEAQTTDGNLIYTAVDLQKFADFYAVEKDYLDYDGAGNDINLVPKIVGRTLNINGVYELDLAKLNSISSGSTSPKVTSQVTRK